MTDHAIAVKAMEIATEIVAAKIGNTSTSTNAESGKRVAEFYAEIYNGIYKTLTSKFHEIQA